MLILAGAFSGCVQPLQKDLSCILTKGVSWYCRLLYCWWYENRKNKLHAYGRKLMPCLLKVLLLMINNWIPGLINPNISWPFRTINSSMFVEISHAPSQPRICFLHCCFSDVVISQLSFNSNPTYMSLAEKRIDGNLQILHYLWHVLGRKLNRPD